MTKIIGYPCLCISRDNDTPCNDIDAISFRGNYIYIPTILYCYNVIEEYLTVITYVNISLNSKTDYSHVMR